MRTIALVVVLLIATAGLVWTLLRSEDRAPSDIEAGAARTSPEAEPVLAGAGAPTTDAGPTQPQEPSQATKTETNSEDAVRRLLLEGRFVGWDRSLPGDLRLEAARVDGTLPPLSWRVPAELPVTKALQFSTDITELVPEGQAELQVTIDHPSYVPFTARLHSAEASANTLRVEVLLRRAGCLQGRVENQDGAPVEGADVAVFSCTDGVPGGGAVHAVKTGKDGAFRLRVGTQGRYVAGAWSPGLQPASVEVEIAPRAVADLGALVLRDGVSIRGVVRYRGAPLAGAVVDVATKADDVPLWLGEARVLWSRDRLHNRYLQTKTDAEGRYAFPGLTRGTHRIVVSGCEGFLLDYEDARDGGREVEAPARDVDFDVAALQLVAEFQCDGRPLADLSVRLSTLVQMDGLPEGDFAVFGYYPTKTDAEGRVIVQVTPGARYVFFIDDDRYERGTTDFVTPKAGVEHRRTIEVKRKPDGPKLDVTLVGPGAEHLEHASFGFWPPDGGPHKTTAHQVRQVECAKGHCLLEDLRPGRWRLVVRPGREWHTGFSYYVETAVEVDVPRAGTAEARIPIRLGGALRITAKDPSGRMLGPRCKVFDAQGEEVVVTFSVRTERGVALSTLGMLAGAPNRVVQALAPGTYELRFTERGYRPKTVEAVIEEGRTRNLEVVMEPTR